MISRGPTQSLFQPSPSLFLVVNPGYQPRGKQPQGLGWKRDQKNAVSGHIGTNELGVV